MCLRKIIVFGLAFFVLSGCGTSNVKKSVSTSPEKYAENVLNPSDHERYRMAIQLMKSGSYGEAANKLKLVTTTSSGFIDAWINLAVSLGELNQFAEADNAIQKASALGANSAEFYNVLGLVDLKNHRYQLAEQHLKNSIGLNSGCVECHYNLGLLYDVYFQNIPKAIEHYEIYLSQITNTDEDTERDLEELKRKLARLQS